MFPEECLHLRGQVYLRELQVLPTECRDRKNLVGIDSIRGDRPFHRLVIADNRPGDTIDDLVERRQLGRPRLGEIDLDRAGMECYHGPLQSDQADNQRDQG